MFTRGSQNWRSFCLQLRKSYFIWLFVFPPLDAAKSSTLNLQLHNPTFLHLRHYPNYHHDSILSCSVHPPPISVDVCLLVPFFPPFSNTSAELTAEHRAQSTSCLAEITSTPRPARIGGRVGNAIPAFEGVIWLCVLQSQTHRLLAVWGLFSKRCPPDTLAAGETQIDSLKESTESLSLFCKALIN